MTAAQSKVGSANVEVRACKAHFGELRDDLRRIAALEADIEEARDIIQWVVSPHAYESDNDIDPPLDAHKHARRRAEAFLAKTEAEDAG